MIQIVLIFGLIFGTDETPYNDIPGTYVRRIQKHSDIRQFGRTLIINCDSTVIAKFQGDMMNEMVKGRWTMNGDTLIVIINEPLGHWRKENLFLVRKKKLLNIVTEINGEKIRDKQLLDAINKSSRK
ncbi:MAG: hypothetical protein ACK514_04040, partial [Bacteroidota bacterium]